MCRSWTGFVTRCWLLQALAARISDTGTGRLSRAASASHLDPASAASTGLRRAASTSCFPSTSTSPTPSPRVEQETELDQVRRRILPSFTFTQDEECEPSTHSPEQREE